MPPLAVLVFALRALAVPEVRASCPPHLFVLERSTNANVVVYDAKRLPSGELDPARPVVAYWIVNEDRGQREELTSFQWNRAYGFGCRPSQKPGRYRMTFKASRGRSLAIQLLDGCPVAMTRIAGRKGIVRRIVVHVGKKFLLLPTVDSVEIFGEDPQTREPLREEFHP